MKQKSNQLWLVLALIGVLILLTKFQFGITPTECQDTSPILKTYYVTVPSDADYIGGTTHYGLQYIGNSIVRMEGSSGYCGKATIQSCPLGTIATVGAEAKGASWGTTIPCSTNMFCADQGRYYDDWGCSPEAPAEKEYCNRELVVLTRVSSGYMTGEPESCLAIDCQTPGQIAGRTQVGPCGNTETNQYGTYVGTLMCGLQNMGGKLRVCYFAPPVCPTDRTISYGCKPDPNYVPPMASPTPCPSSWKNFCNGNDLRKSDGCGQDNLVQTCQYGCNTETASCNAAPVVAACAWNGQKCVGIDLYRTDSICDKQEKIQTCQYGCLNSQCSAAPIATPTPVPTPTYTVISTPLPGYVPTVTPIMPTPDNPTGKSLNTGTMLLVLAVGGIAAWVLFRRQK